jgi:hypothetical protein
MTKPEKPVSVDVIDEFKLDRPLGLIAGIAIVIGGVIDMGIFALIAGIGAEVVLPF